MGPPTCLPPLQVAEKMGDAVRILKIDTDRNPDISTQLQVGAGSGLGGAGGWGAGVVGGRAQASVANINRSSDGGWLCPSPWRLIFYTCCH